MIINKVDLLFLSEGIFPVDETGRDIVGAITPTGHPIDPE